MARSERLLWFKIRDAGNYVWRVYLVHTCRDEDTGWPLHGLTSFDRRTIEVSIKQSARELRATTIHELMHAAGGSKKRSDPASEEEFIRRSEYSMTRMIWQLGARLPDLPPGVKLQPRRRA